MGGWVKEKKPVINITTGKEYVSVRDAAIKNGISPVNLTNHLKGRQHTAAGCVWKFKEQ